ncbi:uncharacterized protein [Rutidosis leptorrhynchoides]|uniref:uncharacterized protein n=1 Tax=Rutidosis leptorrhynchoides TaxID=125765 RepID=UPI003A9A35FB
MDAVELSYPATIVTQIMRSTGCSGGAVTSVELLGHKSELKSCSSSLHPDKDNCNVNGSRPAFWNKMSDEAIYKQADQAFLNQDTRSVPEAKQPQRKSGKTARSNVISSRRSRVAHMEASMNVTGSVDFDDLPKDLGSYSGKYNIAEKKLKTSVSGKRSDKRNGKLSKSKCDSFSVKAGLSSFSSAAGSNNILGVYGSKHDICDFGKQVDEVSLNELLDGSYKCRNSIEEKERKTEVLNGSILSSVRDACSILHLQKPIKTQTAAGVDGAYKHNASCLPNSAVSGAITNDENEGVPENPSSSNQVENPSCAFTDDHANILQFPLVAPKDVLTRLALPPPKDLDLMLLDNMKPTSTSKVQNGGSLPMFPWSHVSGRDLKSNPDVVKSTPSKSSCQGRWVRIRKSTATLWEATATSYLADFQSLTYNQSLVPLVSQRANPIEKEISPTPSISNTSSDRGVTPFDTGATVSKTSVGSSSMDVAAAETLCNIAAQCRKKKSFQKFSRAIKLTSDEKLEKALFTIPNSRPVGPTNLINGPNDTKSHMQKKVTNTAKGQFHWSSSTSQSSRSSPSKIVKNASMELKHHESSSSSSLKRSITTPPERFPNKPPKLRKLLPMEWKSNRGDKKGNGRY